MSKAKAKELDNLRHGNRDACPICNPRKDRVTHSQLWSFVKRTGAKPFR